MFPCVIFVSLRAEIIFAVSGSFYGNIDQPDFEFSVYIACSE
jgi:hypothetical protein